LLVNFIGKSLANPRGIVDTSFSPRGANPKGSQMKNQQAEEIITQSFQNATLEQFLNQAEWLLNGHPILDGETAKNEWDVNGVP